MLTLEKRIETYLAQNGSKSRLTFRQERRLGKVAHRQAKATRGQTVDVKITVDTSGFTGGINACPRCKVMGDTPCVTPTGKTTKTHKGRGE